MGAGDHAAPAEPDPMPVLPCGYCKNGRVTFATSIADGKCFRCDGRGTRFVNQADLDLWTEAAAAEAAHKAATTANLATPEQWARLHKAAGILGTSVSRIVNVGNGVPGDWDASEATKAEAEAGIAFAIRVYRTKSAQRRAMLFPVAAAAA